MSVARRTALAVSLAGAVILLPPAARVRSAAADAACPPKEVFRDDFSRFPPGWLSQPDGPAV